MTAIVSYLLTAMLAWCPPAAYFAPYGETTAEATERLRTIAEDIAAVAFDESEPPVFQGDTGRIKTALLHAAIASKENAFQRFVDEGLCNKRGYVADRRGNCDGGQAYSFWSIHVFGGGYLLLSDGTLSSVAASPDVARARPELIVQGVQLLADRKTAVRVAQRLERQSLRAYHSLCAYSGEPCAGHHPKADARLERAQTYWAEHPFTTTSQPLASNSN